MYCVIARRFAGLQQEMAAIFRGVPEVQVITDRRVEERRQTQAPVAEDRRKRTDRRLSSAVAVFLAHDAPTSLHGESTPQKASTSVRTWLAVSIATLLSIIVVFIGYSLYLYRFVQEGGGTVLNIQPHQLGILLFIVGIILVGCSVRYFESGHEQMLRRMSIISILMMGYRTRIVRWMFWTGLILMALGSVLRW